MRADLDTLVTALYVWVDDLLPKRSGPGCPPTLSDAEIIALAVAQVFLDCPNDRKFLALARWRLGHLFPVLIKQPGYNKRVRALAPQILSIINALAFDSAAFCDRLWLLDSTPVPCGQSRETARRSALAGHAGYGYCRSHSRFFWGFRLFLLCTPDGMPVGFEPRGGQCARAQGGRGRCWTCERTRLEPGLVVLGRQGLRRRRVRAARRRSRRAAGAARPQQTSRPATARWAHARQWITDS